MRVQARWVLTCSVIEGRHTSVQSFHFWKHKKQVAFVGTRLLCCGGADVKSPCSRAPPHACACCYACSMALCMVVQSVCYARGTLQRFVFIIFTPTRRAQFINSILIFFFASARGGRFFFSFLLVQQTDTWISPSRSRWSRLTWTQTATTDSSTLTTPSCT